MRWIAPPERDAAQNTLEKRLWAAADQLRAGRGSGVYTRDVFTRKAAALFEHVFEQYGSGDVPAQWYAA